MTEPNPHYSFPPSLSAPAPIPALPYSVPLARQRPGILTGIGVVSIVVACFSGLASLMTGCQSVGYYMMANVSKTMARSSASMTTYSASVNNGTPGNNANPNGLGPADRAIAVAAMSEMQPLNATRKAQLEAYLENDGSSIFPTGGAALTPTRVKIGVNSSYTHADKGADDPGHTVFVTSWGTLTLYDTRADFLPKGSTAVRSFSADPTAIAANNAAQSDPQNSAATPSASSSTGTALTAAEVQGIVQKAQRALGNKLSAAQAQSLTAALSDPNQQLVTPGTAWSPIRHASINADGSAFIYFTGGFFSIDPQGQSNVNNFTNPAFRVSGIACVLGMLDGLVGIGLAIFLFIAGIMVLGQSPSGRRLHRIYAALKIPLCIAGTAAVCWMNYQLYSSLLSAAPGAGSVPQMMAIGWGGVLGGLGVIYPIVLLFVLRSRGVSQYYNSVRG